MKNWYLRFDAQDLKKKDYLFWETGRLPTKAKRMEIFGPWGKRKLIMMSNPGGESLSVDGSYAGTCPHQGFGLDIRGIPNGSAGSGKYVGYKLTVD